MYFANFECQDPNCGHIQESSKPTINESWTDQVVKCEKCGGDMKWLIHAPLTCVSEGTVGNAANGYTNTISGYQHGIMGPGYAKNRPNKIKGL